LGERNRKVDYALMALLAAGLLCFFVGQETPTRIAPDPSLGNLLAAITGVTWAGTVAGLRWIQRRYAGAEVGMPTILCGNLMVFAFCLGPALPVEAARAVDWALIGYLGVIQIGLAYVLLTRAVKRLPALEVSMLLLSEPAMNPVWTWLWHGETPSRWAIGGGALVLGATLARLFTRERGPAAAATASAS
jgi:drug/metabolite transporter (DMT)-like permease